MKGGFTYEERVEATVRRVSSNAVNLLRQRGRGANP